MKSSLACSVVLGLGISVSLPAAAGEPRRGGGASRSFEPALRGGLFGGVGAWQAESHRASPPAAQSAQEEAARYTSGTPGLIVGGDLGVSLLPKSALKVRAQATTFLFFYNQASAYLLWEQSLGSRWSLASGVGVDATSHESLRLKWVGVSAPLVLTYHFRDALRGAWRLSLEGAIGVDPRNLEDWGGHETLTLGYEWM